MLFQVHSSLFRKQKIAKKITPQISRLLGFKEKIVNETFILTGPALSSTIQKVVPITSSLARK